MKNNNSQVWKMLYLVTQIGLTMLTTIFLCVGIGYGVDRLFGTNLMAWFIVIGAVAGFKSVYILIRRFMEDDEKK